jgi:hypothetical protein
MRPASQRTKNTCHHTGVLFGVTQLIEFVHCLLFISVCITYCTLLYFLFLCFCCFGWLKTLGRIERTAASSRGPGEDPVRQGLSRTGSKAKGSREEEKWEIAVRCIQAFSSVKLAWVHGHVRVWILLCSAV